DGTIDVRELSAPVVKVVDYANPSEADVLFLARAMFDAKFRDEARIKGEGQYGRALDTMWSRTKLDEVPGFIKESTKLLRDRPKTYLLHGDTYIEQGTVFVDPTPAAADAQFELDLSAVKKDAGHFRHGEYSGGIGCPS